MTVSAFFDYLLGRDATRDLAVQLVEVHELRRIDRREVRSSGTASGR